MTGFAILTEEQDFVCYQFDGVKEDFSLINYFRVLSSAVSFTFNSKREAEVFAEKHLNCKYLIVEVTISFGVIKLCSYVNSYILDKIDKNKFKLSIYANNKEINTYFGNRDRIHSLVLSLNELGFIKINDIFEDVTKFITGMDVVNLCR